MVLSLPPNNDCWPDLARDVARAEQQELRHLFVERQELVERVLAEITPVVS